jgi:thiamine biosynthesis protein ThiI
MDRTIVVRYGEISLKGMNRRFFIDKLVSNIHHSTKDIDSVKVHKIQGRIILHLEEKDIEEAITRLKNIFGIVSISPGWIVESDIEEIKNKALEILKSKTNEKGKITFKVESKRGDKSFPIKSPDINKELGGHLLVNLDGYLSVDVHKPDYVLSVEVRKKTYLYLEKIPCLGGMPVGTGGKATLLLSGGIDSPVAGYLMAKRGIEISCVHFHSFPFTSDRSKEKVIKLAQLMTKYCGKITLYIPSFTEIQTEIVKTCPGAQTTLIMRRYMMIIAEKIAEKEAAKALVTGESLGQVASQTIESLGVTNAAVQLPVFRPLISMDKQEIINIAKRINTFETSILPYEDCCTIFVPKHPETKPKLSKIIESETELNIDHLVENAINEAEIIRLYYKQ